MILISHRGNINGKNPKKENKISYLEDAIDKGFRVECDIWYNKNKWWLGHDEPQYRVTFDWIFNRYSYLWIHCKNIEALEKLSIKDEDEMQSYLYSTGINYFWHQTDNYTITSKGYIWVYPGKPIISNCVCVLPEQSESAYEQTQFAKCCGICSDYIDRYKHSV